MPHAGRVQHPDVMVGAALVIWTINHGPIHGIKPRAGGGSFRPRHPNRRATNEQLLSMVV